MSVNYDDTVKQYNDLLSLGIDEVLHLAKIGQQMQWVSVAIDTLPPLGNVVHTWDGVHVGYASLNIDILQFEQDEVPKDYFKLKNAKEAIEKGYAVQWEFECACVNWNEIKAWMVWPLPPLLEVPNG